MSDDSALMQLLAMPTHKKAAAVQILRDSCFPDSEPEQLSEDDKNRIRVSALELRNDPGRGVSWDVAMKVFGGDA